MPNSNNHLYGAPSTPAQQAMLDKAKAYNKISSPGMPDDWAFNSSGQLVRREDGIQVGVAAPGSAPGSGFWGQLLHAAPYIAGAFGMGALGGMMGPTAGAAEGVEAGVTAGLGTTALPGAMATLPAIAGETTALAAPLAATTIGTGMIPAVGGPASGAIPAATAVTTGGGVTSTIAQTAKTISKATGMDYSDIIAALISTGGGALKGLLTPKTGSFADGSETDPRNVAKYGLDQLKSTTNAMKANISKGINLRSSYAQDLPSFGGHSLPMNIGVTGSDPALHDPSLLHLDGLDFSNGGLGGGGNMGGPSGQGRTPSADAVPVGQAMPRTPAGPLRIGGQPDEKNQALAAFKMLGVG